MGTSASFARKALHCLAAALLALTLVPASAFAQEEGEQPQDAVDPQAGEPQETSADQADEGSGSTPAASPVEGGTLASALVGTPTSFINSDVALDGEPVIGSFIVDGMTFAVTEGSDVELVGVSSDRQQVTSSQEGDSSSVAPMLASGPDGSDADSSALAIPESITYEGVDYAVTSIGAYAFYLSGVAAVELPATVADVDDRAFRSSDVASVSVADGNSTYSSFDGALYSADQTSLLLIPEGKQGTVLLPKRAEVADAGKFSHCSLASAIAVEEGSAAFASENGLLYDASLTTLLRVPAGATDITIRDGCTTIAAGAMEACAQLGTITAPASVTSISPDVFTSVPIVSPVPLTVLSGDDEEAAVKEPSSQLSGMVMLSAFTDDTSRVNPNDIEVCVPEGGEADEWQSAGFSVSWVDGDGLAALQTASAYAAATVALYGNGGYVRVTRAGATIAEQVASYSVAIESGKNWTAYAGGIVQIATSNGLISMTAYRAGYDLLGIATTASGPVMPSTQSGGSNNSATYYAKWQLHTYSIRYALDGGSISDEPTSYNIASASFPIPVPKKSGYSFQGWQVTGVQGVGVSTSGPNAIVQNGTYGDLTLTAQWESISLDFETSEEPGDEEYPGEERPSVSAPDAMDDDERIEIADPKRPGYVFQGWVIPNMDGTEAIDQDLVYKDETDGKWYVDASKLPDYANDEGRVELTARWTSVISVDVPSAVTFYADVVTQGNESREGAASSAFGQNKVANQSEVDLRIVGLESTAVATQGSTLGADSILKKSSSAMPSSSTQKLFSLYPTDKALTPDDLQDPDAVSTTKPVDAVDFALDDILLEKSFVADAFTIPAGDTLNLGYRLNLSETGTELDYDTLSTLDEGQSASIANISYTFATDADLYGDFWLVDRGMIYDASALKEIANDLAQKGTLSDWYEDALHWMGVDAGGAYVGNEVHAYVNWGDGITYQARIIGVNHDDKADGSGKAGLTFQFVDCLNAPYMYNAPIVSGEAGWVRWDDYQYYYDSNQTPSSNSNSGGWGKSMLRANMNPGPNGVDDASLTTSLNAYSVDTDAIWSQVPDDLKRVLAQVRKGYYAGTSYAQAGGTPSVSADWLFVPSYSELVAQSATYYGASRYWANLAKEGSPYAYYQACGVVGNASQIASAPSNNLDPDPSSTIPESAAANALLKWQIALDGQREVNTDWKAYGGNGIRTWTWWMRSVSPDYSYRSLRVAALGGLNSDPYCGWYNGVSPAFCL